MEGGYILLKLIDEHDKCVKRWLLPEGQHSLGKTEECDVQIKHYSLSRKHAQLVVTPSGSLSISDIGSCIFISRS